jgi:hypothetical protein
MELLRIEVACASEMLMPVYEYYTMLLQHRRFQSEYLATWKHRRYMDLDLSSSCFLDSVGIIPHEFVAVAYSTVHCGSVVHVLTVSS